MTTQIIEEVPTRFGAPHDAIVLSNWQELPDTYQCRVVFCPEDEGGYSAHALRLPGVVSQGETIDEAIQNIKEAFRGAIGVYRDEKMPIPWQDVDVERPNGSLERWILVDV